MGHMFALFIQEPSGSRYTALGPGRGPERTAHRRDAGRGRTGGAPAAPGPCGTPRTSPAGGGAGRGRPRPPSPADGGRAGSGAEHPRGAAASPRLARCRRRPLGSAPAGERRGRGGTRRNRSGRASRPSQFSLAKFGCRQRGHPRSAPAASAPRSLRAPRTAPAPASIKLRSGGVKRRIDPGGARESRGSGLSQALPAGLTPAAGPGCAAGGGRALRVWCVHPIPAPRASRSLPGNRRCPPKEATGAPAPLPLARSLTHITDTHT
ncbi:uncharacterized protein LOC113459632 [Zonotrichia albicollis]|uniref:uncharacterized protein LOC113459632 n=1 Tax=Zonotrichia albicollis TaxID=44394 RepID=UPI003D80E57D